MKYMIAMYDSTDGERDFCWDLRNYEEGGPKYESEDKEDALHLLKKMQDYGKMYFPTCSYNLVAIYE
jgi:hypothetical protein